MVDKEVSVTGPQNLDVVLEFDNTLEGAEIVGAYGTRQRKEDLVGSAFQVNSDVLKDKPVARVDNLLEGLVPHEAQYQNPRRGFPERIQRALVDC